MTGSKETPTPGGRCCPAGVCLRDTAQNRQSTGVPTPMTLRVRSRSTAR
jgi:hypothetical protein